MLRGPLVRALAPAPAGAPTQRHWLPAARVDREGLVRAEDGGPAYRAIVSLATMGPRAQNRDAQAQLVQRLAAGLTTANMDLHWLTRSRPGGAGEWVDARRVALRDGRVAAPLVTLASQKLDHVRQQTARGQLRTTDTFLAVTGTTTQDARARQRRLCEAMNAQGYVCRPLTRAEVEEVLALGYRFTPFRMPPGQVGRYGELDGDQALWVDDRGRVRVTGGQP
jgi:hypothetical protein